MRGDAVGRAGSISTSGRSSAPSIPGATRSVAASRSSACSAAACRRSTRSTSAAASRSCRSTNWRRRRSGSLARSRPCSPRCPRTAARPVWRSSPGGRSSPGQAGSWRASSTSASAVGRQVVIDAGMTELIRPALYGARHPIVALTSLGRSIAPDEMAAARARPGRRSDLRIDRRARHPRPAAAAPRRPRRDQRRRGVRRVARIDLQRPAACPTGPGRHGRAACVAVRRARS